MTQTTADIYKKSAQTYEIAKHKSNGEGAPLLPDKPFMRQLVIKIHKN